MALIRELMELVKFEHTVFALPFALAGAFLGAGGWPHHLGWVVLAVIGGRTLAMALNRIIDAPIDAQNPRTASRAIPAGRVSRAQALALAAASLALMVGATLQLPPLCVKLLPLALLILGGYSYTKRFTWACHLVLGMALGAAAAGGWIAETGSLAWGPVLLGLTVAFWTAGFDIIYACQDVDFDRQAGLHSIPARLGLRGGLRVSALLHAVTVLGLAGIGLLQNLGLFWWLGVALVTFFLRHEHRLVSADDLSKLDAAFFNLNGYVSLAMLSCTVLNFAWGLPL